MDNQSALISGLESKFRRSNVKLQLELTYWRNQLNESKQELASFKNALKRVKDDLIWRFDTKSLEHKKALLIQEKYLEEAVKHNQHMVEMRELEISRLGGFICDLRADDYNYKLEMDGFYKETSTI